MSITIALVDEQVLIRKALKELLESFEGMKVQVEADNGLTLIERLYKKSSLPDICVISSTAFMFAEIWTVQEMRKRFEKMKIVALVSHFHELTVAQLIHEKVNGFLLKNSKPVEFKKALLAVYNDGKYRPRLSKELKKSITTDEFADSAMKKKHLQFLELCMEDISYREMSIRTGTPVRTIEGYRDYLFEKFNVNSRTSLVFYAVKNGLIELK